MEIEITTTKKKLTKALINQMQYPIIGALQSGTSLGYLINIRKNSAKCILIEHNFEYFIISACWIKNEDSVYRSINKHIRTKKFKTRELCDEWWRLYMRLLKNATTQIYI